MKAYICDNCHTQAEPDKYDLTPEGWMSLSPRDDAKTYHYCGARCLRTAAEDRCAREQNLSTVQNISPVPPSAPTMDPEIAEVLAEKNETTAGAM